MNEKVNLPPNPKYDAVIDAVDELIVRARQFQGLASNNKLDSYYNQKLEAIKNLTAKLDSWAEDEV